MRRFRIWMLFAVLLAVLVALHDEADSAPVFQGYAIDSLMLAASETTAVFDLRGAGATQVGIQADCDSLRATIQLSLTGFDAYASVGDTALTLTSAALWMNLPTPSQPLLLNGTPGTPAIHWMREVSVVPPDGAISSDFSSNVAPAPFMRIIFENIDTTDTTTNVIVRINSK